MHPRRPILAVAAIVAGFTFDTPGLAQGRRGLGRLPLPPRVERHGRISKTPIDEFEMLPPDQQRRELDRLPRAQREKLQQRLQHFNELPPEQQRALRNLYNRLHQLPPERQDAVRKAVRKFSDQPADRQSAIRDELRGMAGLSEEDRKARTRSPEFKSKFSKKEQEIVRDMAELVGGGD